MLERRLRDEERDSQYVPQDVSVSAVVLSAPRGPGGPKTGERTVRLPLPPVRLLKILSRAHCSSFTTFCSPVSLSTETIRVPLNPLKERVLRLVIYNQLIRFVS